MKYKLISLKKNGPYDYSLQVEEVVSVWSRFFGLSRPKSVTIRGDGRGYWETMPIGVQLRPELIEFADSKVKEYPHGYGVRVWF